MPPEPFRILDPAGVIESIRRDLERLLNTRTRTGFSAASASAGTAIHYGLPDFAHISPSDIQQCEALAASIAKIIEAFEPRLSQVRVTLQSSAADPGVLTGSIEGKVPVNLVPEPVSFALELRAGSGAVIEGLKAAEASQAPAAMKAMVRPA